MVFDLTENFPLQMKQSKQETVLRCFYNRHTIHHWMYNNAYTNTARPIASTCPIQMVLDLEADFSLQIETIQTTDSLRCFAFVTTDTHVTTGLYYNAYTNQGKPIALTSPIPRVLDLTDCYLQDAISSIALTSPFRMG